jgi:hypothetical protein
MDLSVLTDGQTKAINIINWKIIAQYVPICFYIFRFLVKPCDRTREGAVGLFS